MRTQSRIVNLLLFIALSTTVTGGLSASPLCTNTVDTSDIANRDENREYFGAGGPATQDKAPPETTPLPAEVMNTELPALDGSTFKLADYRGKVVIVNLWATWCGPCRAEIPNLVRLNQELKARGVVTIGLTMEDPESYSELVTNFVSAFKITYKIGWSDRSFILALMQGQVRNSIPQTFVISRDGRVVKRFVGFNRVQTPAILRQAIEDALNKK